VTTLLTGPFIGSSLGAAVAAPVGLFGPLLASMGIYGTVSYIVALRTREVGIRKAVGAQKATTLSRSPLTKNASHRGEREKLGGEGAQPAVRCRQALLLRDGSSSHSGHFGRKRRKALLTNTPWVRTRNRMAPHMSRSSSRLS
jgi:hypothetical protein